MLFRSVMKEYGDLTKIKRFEARVQKDIPEVLLENAAKIGCLRKLSLDEVLGLRFSNLEYSAFLAVDELAVKEEAFTRYVLTHSRRQSIYSCEALTDYVTKEVEENNVWQMSCGHDVMALLTLGLIHQFGDYNAKRLIVGQLEGSFRMAYQKEYFEATKLYRDLLEWELTQGKYCLFCRALPSTQ